MILKSDFYELAQMSDQDEAQRLETLLTQIGALTMHAGSTHALVKVEVLMAAMRVHGQE